MFTVKRERTRKGVK